MKTEIRQPKTETQVATETRGGGSINSPCGWAQGREFGIQVFR